MGARAVNNRVEMPSDAPAFCEGQTELRTIGSIRSTMRLLIPSEAFLHGKGNKTQIQETDSVRTRLGFPVFGSWKESTLVSQAPQRRTSGLRFEGITSL